MPARRLAVALGVLALLAGACSAPAGEGAGDGPPVVGADGLPIGPSALRDVRNPSFPPPLVDPADIAPGGPPPDGIPPIEDPQFTTVGAADEYLADTEAVAVLVLDDDARAYPVRILISHEIVNDTVGGVPVSITYCPLCNSAVTYVRTVRGVETTFGTSGRLYNSALVMYDRATETLWTHYDGRAVVGLLAGDNLEPVASPLASWADFKAQYPEGLVLDKDETGFRYSYDYNPYSEAGGLGRPYDDPGGRPFLYFGAVDERAAPMQRVVGVTIGDESKAWAQTWLAVGLARVAHDNVGGEDIVIFWKAGQASAVEAPKPRDGRDVGTVGVFRPLVEGRELTFGTDGEAFVDDQTGSRWNVFGEAVSGPLAGTQLRRINHLDTFWFAWQAYRPDTGLVGG